MPTKLSVELAPGHAGGLSLANPVMTASGTCGYGIEYSRLIDIQGLGAIVCKGTTLMARKGNPQPRIAETPCGVLNAIGLQNIGVEALIREKAPVWAGWQIPVIVNIAGDAADEYGSLAHKLEGVPGISALEVNISCPNVSAGGAEFGINPHHAARVTRAVRDATSLPVLVKLTPSAADITEVAKAVADAGADAITLINTITGMSIDIARRAPLLGNSSGGLSGPAIKPVALYMVYRVAGAVDIPLIGCGGITDADDAIEFLMAGATAVQVGTASLSDPDTPHQVLEGIKSYMEREGITDISHLVGAARRHF